MEESKIVVFTCAIALSIVIALAVYILIQFKRFMNPANDVNLWRKNAKPVAGKELKFSHSEFIKLSEAQQECLFAFSHIMNRINMQWRWYFSSMSTSKSMESSEVEKEIATSCSIEAALFISGELKEGWETINRCYNGKRLSKEMHDQLPAVAKQAYKELAKCFSKNSLLAQIRNDFAFHHSPSLVREVVSKMDKETMHTLYVFHDHNDSFIFASHMRNAALIPYLTDDQWQAKSAEFGKALNHASEQMSIFMNAAIVLIIHNMKYQFKDIGVSHAPLVNDLRINCFYHSENVRFM